MKEIIKLEPAAKPFSSSVSGASLDRYVSVLKSSLAKYCLIYEFRFQELVDALNVDGVSFKVNVELLIAYPPYNILQQKGGQIQNMTFS